MQIDAVEIIARLFIRDGELRLVDEALQIARGQREIMGEFASREIGEIAVRQGLQIEPRAARAQLQLARFAGRLQRDLRAVGELAHDVIERMGGQRRAAGGADVGREPFGHFEIEIGRLEEQRAALRLEKHVGQDRDGVAALHHAMDVAERLQKRRAFESDFHGRPIGSSVRKPDQSPAGGADFGSAQAKSQGSTAYSPPKSTGNSAPA